jgi:hypothetical protein
MPKERQLTDDERRAAFERVRREMWAQIERERPKAIRPSASD